MLDMEGGSFTGMCCWFGCRLIKTSNDENNYYPQHPIDANKSDYHLDRQVLQGECVGLLLPGNCRTSGRQLPSPLH